MITLIDNYDSFTYNLVHYIGDLGVACRVYRNDKISVDDLLAEEPSAIVLSPGPCTPNEAGICLELIKAAADTIPILGVCLGHQAIGEAYGGVVIRADRVMHGKTSRITHSGTGLFAGLPDPLEVMRYHSLIVERKTLPSELEILAVTADTPDEIQAVRHVTHPVWGVQFHPESILTQQGRRILENFLTMASDAASTAAAA